MSDDADLSQALRHHQAGEVAEAAECYRRILARLPGHAEATHLLGVLMHQTGRVDEAIALIRRAITLSPSTPHYHSNLAGIMGRHGREAEAVPLLKEAIRLKPHFPEAYHNLGTALQSLGRLEEAEDAYRAAIGLRPAYAEAHNQLGTTLRRQGRLDEAVAYHREAVRLRPDLAAVHTGLASALSELGDAAGLIACHRKSIELNPRSAAAHSALLYVLHYDARLGPEQLFAEHIAWASRHCARLGERSTPRPPPSPPNPSAPGRLRIGYVSPDFREHTVPRFIEPVLTHHDRARFEVFCYSDVAHPDATTARLRTLVEHWREIRGLSDDRAADLIHRDGIQVLVDLRGHAGGNRLTMFAARPAPVQVTMVGYFNTTGLAAMDYRITDAIQDPAGETERFHTEKLIRLPNSCWCYRPDPDAPNPAPPPSLARGCITFGCLNKLVKVNAVCGRLWSSILEAVTGSRLLLSVAAAEGGFDPRPVVSRFGLPPDRVDFVTRTRTRREYLERYHQIDIALDTFPFNGITTTCDGLWMGVPHITLAGETSVSRAGASILTAAGLADLIAWDANQYLTTAVDLARDQSRLIALRTVLRQRLAASPLTDGRTFTANFENGLLRPLTA